MAKLSIRAQRELIFKRTGFKRQDVVVWPGVAEDSAVMATEGKRYVVSHTDPITDAVHHVGKIAVQVSSNDVATKGARPSWSLVTLLVPTGSKIDAVDSIMKEVDEESKRLGIAVVGGHTEFTDAVRRPVVSITQVGMMNGEPLMVSNIRPGDDIIMVNEAGIEGTAVIAFDHESYARRVLGERISEAWSMIDRLSIIDDALKAYELGVTAIHDTTEGGVVAAALELSIATGLRATLDLTKVPVKDVTKDLCDGLGLNPYMLLSSGAFIAASRGAATELIIREFNGKARVVGKFTEAGEGLLVFNGSTWNEINDVPKDEIEKLTEP